MIAGVVEPDSPEILNQHEVAAGRWFMQCVYEPAAVGRKGKPTGRAFFSEVGDLLNVVRGEIQELHGRWIIVGVKINATFSDSEVHSPA